MIAQGRRSTFGNIALDRAILATFYFTGMLRLELLGLKLYDLDVERETVIVRQGKGKKDG